MKRILVRKLGASYSNQVSIRVLSFDMSEPLPKQLIVEGADSLLYRMGISLFNYESDLKRSVFYNPKLIFFVMITNLIRCFVMLLMSTKPHSVSPRIHLYASDIDFFLDAGNLVNIISIISSMSVLISQAINYYNFKNDIKPTDWRVFQVMSGSLTPDSIGLGDKSLFIKLINKFKVFWKLAKTNIQLITFLNIYVNCLICPGWITALELILIYLPNAIHWTMWINYVFSHLFYQFMYFVFIVEYLKIKLMMVNRQISQRNNIYRGVYTQKSGKLKIISITKILKNLNSIYNEIEEYNEVYWSKFVFILWFGLTVNTSSLSFSAIFVMKDIILVILFAILAVIDVILILLLIRVSTQIYSEVESTYKLLNLTVQTPMLLATRLKVIMNVKQKSRLILLTI